MKNNFFEIIVVAILASSCVYPRYFRGPSKDGYGHITLRDSVSISVSYMETFVSISWRHAGSSITIRTFDESELLYPSKIPIEVSLDSLFTIKTKFFELRLDTVYFSKNAIRKGNTVFFSDGNVSVNLWYVCVDFKIKDKKHYSETQKVWIPSFTIKQGGKEYVTKGFEAVYPKR